MGRRAFLAVAAATGTRILGANDRIRRATINRGTYLTTSSKNLGRRDGCCL